ncbi:MAG TPA: thioredoxin domain-containing protein [Acidobacteriaceae bacterium]|nr:thioredoxin domain-containing protein [Acidobacteriaceae bacterium]
MLKLSAPLRLLPLLLAASTVGCHAQSKSLGPVQPGQKLSQEESRRVEVLIRSRSQMPPDYNVQIGTPKTSDISGFESLPVTYTSPQGTTRNIEFLISNDGKTLAQMNRFDISEDPKEKVSAAGRPARGGPENAPVLIVGFDDLECPFCAQMHAELFPAILNRYKDQVRIVYRDFPLEQHPWAVRAAVDANCLGAESGTAYWNYVDYVHAHASEMGGTDHSLDKAKQSLDKLALDEGAKSKVDQPMLTACILKQDAAKVNASVLDAESDALRVGSTPTLFINGEKVEGVNPIETIYAVIDRALVAAGQTPPPLPAKPAPAASSPAAAAPAVKPGT